MAHFLDLLAIFGLWSVVYECIVSSFLFIIHYSIALIRFCFPYLIIFLILYIFAKSLLTGYGYGYKVKIFGINLNKYTNVPQLNYFIFFIQEYNYFILLMLNLIFFMFIFYYGLYYNIFIIGIFLLFYVFLGLNIFLKYLIKKYEPTVYANRNMLHFYLNIILCIVMLLYVSLIGDTIFKVINFKIDFTEYVLGTALRKDRFFFKLQKGYKFSSLWALYKNEKFSINYLFLKNNIFKNNILNQISYPKLKYSNLNSTSSFYTLINKENLDNIQIEQINLETLNFNNNNIYFENDFVWYENKFQNKNLEQFNEITKAKIFKYNNNITWFRYLLNAYNLNWSDYMPSKKELQNITTLLKSEKYTNYEYLYDLLLVKDDVKLLNEHMLNNYNDYTLLKKKIDIIYTFDFYTLFKYKYVYNKDIFNFINELFLITNKNSINLQNKDIFNFRYQDINDIINKLFSFKNNLLELLNDENNFNIILYKYNYILNWWEKNYYIIHNMYSDSVYKQKYASLTKYLVTEKKLLDLNLIDPNSDEIEEAIEELNSNHWIAGLLSPLDLLKKSTVIKFIDRNIFYFNIYKDLLSFNLKEKSNYYYDYLFREFGLFKINHVMYSVVTFERPDNWFDYLFKEYLPFLKNIGIYEKINSFWKYHRPTKKYFYYFLDYNNKLSLVSNNVLYNVSESTYFRNMAITTNFEGKLLDFNKGKWDLYFDLIGFRYKKFIESCYNIYAYDLNYDSYNEELNVFKQKFFKKSTINQNINTDSGTNWVQLLKFWLNLHCIEKVDPIKNYILAVADNAYPENPKFKKYLLANAEYMAIHWAGKFGNGASLIEFINMLKNLNIFLLNEKDPYVEYLKTHKFQDLKNKFLNRSDYWDTYSYYSQFSCKEELIVCEKLTMVNNRMKVAELAYNTEWCMTLDPVEYDKNFEFLIYKTFFEYFYYELLGRHYYWRITVNRKEFLNDFLPEMLKDQKAFKRALYKFYFDDHNNPFMVLQKYPEPLIGPRNHPFPLIFMRTSTFANAMGFFMLDKLKQINLLLDLFFCPQSKKPEIKALVLELLEANRDEWEPKGKTLKHLQKNLKNVDFAKMAYKEGLINRQDYIYLMQTIDESNALIYDPDYIKKQIVDRVEYYHMLFQMDAMQYLTQRYLNDLEFYEDIINEIVTEYDEIIEDVELEVKMKLKSLLEWKHNKDIYKVERLKKELNDIIDNDLFLSLEKYLLNKNWKKYNYQRYRDEFPATFKDRLHFFKNKK